MQRLFFHNQHDAKSIEELSSLDSTVKIYDVFGKDANNLPPNIKLSSLPYLIDKNIVLTTQPPYSVGVLDLKFNCLDYLDNILTTENGQFDVYINGDRYFDIASNGVIDFQFTVSQAMSIEIKIFKDGYLPFDMVIEVT